MIIFKCFFVGILWIEGNVEELLIDIVLVDVYIIVFGIRNVIRIYKVIINFVFFLFFLDYK